MHAVKTTQSPESNKLLINKAVALFLPQSMINGALCRDCMSRTGNVSLCL